MVPASEKIIPIIVNGIQARYNNVIAKEKITLRETPPFYQGTHTLLLHTIAPTIGVPHNKIGDELGKWLLDQSPIFKSYNIQEKFLNLTLSDTFWWEALETHNENPVPQQPTQKIILEIAAPNTNKPLHIGHLRNSFIGDAVANILQALGHHIKRLIHINDRGVHICKSMLAYQRQGQGKTPQSESIKGDHFVGDYYVLFDKMYKAEKEQQQAGNLPEGDLPITQAIRKMLLRWEEGDKETHTLWEKMNRWVLDGFNATYKKLEIAFDKRYYESETYTEGKSIVEEGVKRGIFYRKGDQSIWVDLDKEKLGQKLLLRSDGTAVYITQDLGTADLRDRDFSADQSIYVVGDEQNYHFQVLFAILNKLQRPYAPTLVHLSYGMVDLPDGKMKSREGNVIDADDLIEEMVAIAREKSEAAGKGEQVPLAEREQLHETLALGALKFSLLKISPQKRILFDRKKALDFHGDSGTFIQYTHARIHTMLERVRKEHGIPSTEGHPSPLEESERKMLTTLVSYRDIVTQAGEEHNPALITHYLLTLAKHYNRFYNQMSILREEDPSKRKKRYLLSVAVMESLRRGAQLLGMKLPQRM